MGASVFLGTFNHNLDTKNRLTVPSKFLPYFKDKHVIVSKGFEGCLEIRATDDFEKYSQKLLALSQNKANTRILLRQLLANAADIEIDQVNRILIPANLLLEAKIDRSVVIIGVGNKCEIWNIDSYENFKKNSDNLLEKLAEEIENENF